MSDRFFLLSFLFSLGIHGLVASFLIPCTSKTSSYRPFALEVIWVKGMNKPTFGQASDPRDVSKDSPSSLKHHPSSRNDKTESPRVIKKKTFKPAPIQTRSMPANLADSTFHELGSFGAEKTRKETSGNLQTNVSKLVQKQAYKPLPKYPWVCRKRGQEGIVSLKVKTDEKGRVKEVIVHKSSGYERLDKSALETIKLWVFSEGEFQKILSIAFRLKEEIKYKI